MSPIPALEGCPEFVKAERTHVCNDRNRDIHYAFIVQCESEMMPVNDVVTDVGPQNNRYAVCVEIVSSPTAIVLAPMPAFELDFAHPYRDLRGKQIRC